MDFRAQFRPRFDGVQPVFVFTGSFALVHTRKMRNSLVLDARRTGVSRLLASIVLSVSCGASAKGASSSGNQIGLKEGRDDRRGNTL